MSKYTLARDVPDEVDRIAALTEQNERCRATNAALAERVQAMEAALDKAADELATEHELRERALRQTAEWISAANAYRNDAARLRAVVEQVEWVGNVKRVCPWCYSDRHIGHAPDCLRQAALAQTSEVKA